MRTKDNKRIIFCCTDCGNMNRWGKWEFVSKKALAEMESHTGFKNVDFVKAVCPTCCEKKQKEMKEDCVGL